MSSAIHVAFVGNPNCGKTTLFNDYTGAKLKVANWPGVTVEKKEGAYRFKGEAMRLVDLPGIYSLTSYTMEEKVSRGYILGSSPYVSRKRSATASILSSSSSLYTITISL